MKAYNVVLSHVRRLSIKEAVAYATAASTSEATISISQAKARLKCEYDPDNALAIYNSISKHHTSPISSRYAQECTVKRFMKARRFSDIEVFLENHKKDPQITEEPFLASIIRSYGVAGMLEHALKTYNQMEDFGTPKSVVSFNALLVACCNSKQFNLVPKLFEEISQRDFSPNEVSYGILIRAYCEMGKPELGIERLKEMEEKGVNITTVALSTILSSLYKRGNVDEAEKFWKFWSEKRLPLDVGAYNVRIMMLHDKEPEIVKCLIEEMSNSGIKPDTITYNYLMACYFKNGMLDDARKVYENLEKNGCRPNITTFKTLVFRLRESGRFMQAYKVFKKSVKVNKIPDFGTLKYLVEGLVEKSRMDEAKGMIRTLKKKFPPNSVKALEDLVQKLGPACVDKKCGSEEVQKANI